MIILLLGTIAVLAVAWLLSSIGYSNEIDRLDREVKAYEMRVDFYKNQLKREGDNEDK